MLSCHPHCHNTMPCRGCAVFVDIRALRRPSADCPLPSGWLRCCRPCARTRQWSPAAAWTRGTIPPTYWGWAGGWCGPTLETKGHTFQPFFICPHVMSLLPTLLDSLGTTAHIFAVCSLKHKGVLCIILCETQIMSDHDKPICLFSSA